MLWEWANDPEVRVVSFSPAQISWEEHIRWFSRKLNDLNCLHFIALDEYDTPIGQARLDMDGEEAEIDISVDSKRRGRGYGAGIIDMAVRKAFSETSVNSVNTHVKPDNEASALAFRETGFQDLGVEMVRGNRAIHFLRRRDNG